MNELRRMAYLEALGVDHYVSRRQLPGAAPTRRLKVVAAFRQVQPSSVAASIDTLGAPARTIPISTSDLMEGAGRAQNAPVTPIAKATAIPAGATGPQSDVVPPFSLSTIVAGDWLWIEDMAGRPLASDQVQLVTAMARALVVLRSQGAIDAPLISPISVDKAQFNWPIHTNQQFDLSEDTACSAVAAFVQRRLQQHECRGLVVLGEDCGKWLQAQQLAVPVVATLGSVQMLANPDLKRQVWRDLRLLAQPS